MDKHIFISYAYEDRDFADALVQRIESAGYKTWIDSNRLYIGEEWSIGISQAIKGAFALIVIMTPEAKKSEYVAYEWAFALGLGIKIVPLLREATRLHPELGALQYLDFSQGTRPGIYSVC